MCARRLTLRSRRPFAQLVLYWSKIAEPSDRVDVSSKGRRMDRLPIRTTDQRAIP
jgi:hypothetical protein